MSEQPSSQQTVTPEQKPLIGGKDVEKMLGIGRDALIDLRRNPRVGFPKPLDLGGRLLRWHPDDVDAWMENRRKAAKAAA
jgi:predicted DNA-binding transcriptional regulator AlpA